jgi:flagellar protein FlaG
MASDSFNVAASSPMPMTATPSLATQTRNSETVSQTSATAERVLTGQTDSNPLAKDQPGTVEQVGRAVDRINEMMQHSQQMLSFQLDDDSGRMVIRVTDAQTKEVIRQIPSEETLKFAQYVDGLVGLIFNKKA